MSSQRNRHHPSKRLGQNFLNDQGISEEIVASIAPGRSDVVLEPGPGHGKLTRLLLEKAGKVIAVEKDPVLAEELRLTFGDRPNLTVVEGDFLKMGESLPSFNKLVSTPPYYISSKLTLLMTEKNFQIAGVVFQKEFGDRLLAEPGTADYGRLTVMARRKLNIEKIKDISRTAFSPRPKVDSVLLRFTKKQVADIDEALFNEMVRGIFTQRRRLLRSAMAHFLKLKFGREVGKKLVEQMPPSEARVYQLSIGQLESLSLQVLKVVTVAIESGQLKM